MQEFNYLIEKINKTENTVEPFNLLMVNNFFSESHFKEIIKSTQISTPVFSSDIEMFEYLFNNGYKIIDFPGCIANQKEYISWHNSKSITSKINTSCESFGMTLRLMEPKSNFLLSLNTFLQSDSVKEILSSKFSLDLESLYFDHGIQKYLDGYEISPHPDIRRKALTYMININPYENSEKSHHHTHYLRLKEEYKFIEHFWTGRSDIERCWLPWSWCETIFQQNANNSFVVFSPNNHTLHAVKADYDHLQGQRTQIYGNYWYKKYHELKHIEWEAFDLDSFSQERGKPIPKNTLGIPSFIKEPLKKLLGHSKENYIKIDNQPKRDI